MRRKQFRLSIALALALGLSQAHALGLGQMQVQSGLDQPLVAEIPIVSAEPGELESLQVRLASPEAFQRVGLERPTRLAANLQFEVVEAGRAQPVIRVTTDQPVDEPLLSFLIEVDWGAGRMLREFTALLDPPYIAPAVLRPATQAPTAASTPAAPPVAAEPAEPAEPVASSARPATSEAAPAPSPAAAPPPPPRPAPQAGMAGGAYGPVEAGQTLSEIAGAMRPAGVSLNQMMIALQSANPDAFIDGNIHLIRRGAVLRMPEATALEGLGRSEADALVRQHTETWQQRIAPVPQPAVPALAEAEAEAASARVASAGTAAEAEARLEIVPASGDDSGSADSGQTGAASGGTGSELRAELIRAQEDLAAREAESDELRSRVADLEAQRANQQRLLEMQNSRMAALEARLRELNEDEALVAAEPAAVSGAAPAQAATAAEEAQATVSSSRWPWFLAGVLLLALGAAALFRRRRAAAPPAYGLAGDPDPVQDDADGVPAAADDADFDGDARALALEEAVAADPDDPDRHLALLRHHYDRGDSLGFAAAANAMHASVGTPAPHWQAVHAMGVVIVPAHPLFAGQAPDETAPVVQDFDAETGPAPVDTPAGAWDTFDGGEGEPGVDRAPASGFHDLGAAESGEEEAPSPFTAPEADRGEPAALAGWSEDERYAEIEAFEPEAGPDLDSEPELEPEPESEFDASEAPVSQSQSQSQSAGEAFDAEGAETKLELARAYLDIGDGDGARGMLEEVIEEGRDEQRAEARRLLDQIG